MKKVLVIEESALLREFYNRQLTEHGFEVVVAVNGLDGIAKLRREVPDLLIMDYFLSRASGPDVLARKDSDPNAKDVPVIMISEPLSREAFVQIAGYNVKKFFNKPVKLDDLLRAVADCLDVTINIDDTPSLVEAHVNDQVLFIEIAQGLNREKIELLRYRVQELLNLHEVRSPRVLLMMASVEVNLDSGDGGKLKTLFNNVMDVTGVPAKQIKILTRSEGIRKFINANADFSGLEVAETLEQAMDGLFGRKTGNYVEKGSGRAQDHVLRSESPRKSGTESFNMRFSSEAAAATDEFSEMRRTANVAVVDDDEIIQELIKTAFEDSGVTVSAYSDGQEFTDDPQSGKKDLVFLDLLMPRKDGFSVLNELRGQSDSPPVIVLSAVSQRDAVIKAMQLGVKSYLIKPLKPENVLRKAVEVLGSNF